MALRDLALTVLELEPDEFHWVLMEAVQADSEDCLGYRPVDSSTQGLPDYSEALVQGASALRVLQGLAPFGKPKSPFDKPKPPVGIGESTSERSTTQPVIAKDTPRRPKDGTDSCMFTTGHPVL
jgi:hypothetical protein